MNDLDAFDPEVLRWDGMPLPEVKLADRKHPSRVKGAFLAPTSWAWLEAAAQLPGQSLAVGLCLWRRVGMRKNRTVRICMRNVGLGVNQFAARRAVRCLETAGLVAVVREPGRGLLVTVLDVETASV